MIQSPQSRNPAKPSELRQRAAQDIGHCAAIEREPAMRPHTAQLP
jgi:hypothetical protein